MGMEVSANRPQPGDEREPPRVSLPAHSGGGIFATESAANRAVIDGAEEAARIPVPDDVLLVDPMSAHLIYQLDIEIQRIIDGLPDGTVLPDYQEIVRVGRQRRLEEEKRVQASFEEELSRLARPEGAEGPDRQVPPTAAEDGECVVERPADMGYE
jgi:hypothetical protein